MNVPTGKRCPFCQHPISDDLSDAALNGIPVGCPWCCNIIVLTEPQPADLWNHDDTGDDANPPGWPFTTGSGSTSNSYLPADSIKPLISNPVVSGHESQHSTEPTTEWINCPGCHGEIGISVDWTEDRVTCPMCNTVTEVSSKAVIRYRKLENKSGRSGFRVAGVGSGLRVATWAHPGFFGIAGLVVFVAIANAALMFWYHGWYQASKVGSSKLNWEDGIITGILLNPVFWLLLLLVKWCLHQSKKMVCPNCKREFVEKNIDEGNSRECPKCYQEIFHPRSWWDRGWNKEITKVTGRLIDFLLECGAGVFSIVFLYGVVWLIVWIVKSLIWLVKLIEHF